MRPVFRSSPALALRTSCRFRIRQNSKCSANNQIKNRNAYSFDALRFIHVDAVDFSCELLSFFRKHAIEFTSHEDLSVVYFAQLIDSGGDLSISREVQSVYLLFAADGAFDCLTSMHSEADTNLVVATKSLGDSGMTRICVQVVCPL